jgi:magnesium transporter
VEFKSDTLTSLNFSTVENLYEILGDKKFANLLSALDTDDAIDVVHDFEDDIVDSILSLLDNDKRKQILEGLTYPEDSAGRVMEKDFVALRQDWNIGQCIDAIRNKSVSNDFYAAIIVDPTQRPQGCILLASLLKHPRNSVLKDVMDRDIKIADTHTDLEELTYMFKQYSLSIAPVVNKAGRLVGAISVNNMIYIMEEQNEAELMSLGGVYNHDLFYDFFSVAKLRFPWLFINLITACIAALLIDLFNDTIAKFVTIAAIMPIVASMGGNAGTQTMTVTVRALHNKELHYSNASRVVLKEIMVSLFNGTALAIIGGMIILISFGEISLSLIFIAAVVISCVVAGFCGASIPILLDKVNIDPAAASGVLLTAITDILGFCSFLILAYLFLG